MLAPLGAAEVESEQAAAHRSVVDVLEGFVGLFGQQAFQPAPTKVVATAPSTAPATEPAGKGATPADGSSEGAEASAQLQPPPQQQLQQPPADVWALLDDVRRRAAAGQLLGEQPLLAMRLLVGGVQPQQLQLDIEQQLAPAAATAASVAAAASTVAEAAVQARCGGAAAVSSEQLQLQAATALTVVMPHFALVAPKLAALAGELMHYRTQAAAAAVAAAAAGAAAEQDGGGIAVGIPSTSTDSSSPGWCGIVFVTQRMAAWALHKLLG